VHTDTESVSLVGKSGTRCSTAYMSQTRDQKFTISEVAVDWHELMIPQCGHPLPMPAVQHANIAPHQLATQTECSGKLVQHNYCVANKHFICFRNLQYFVYDITQLLRVSSSSHKRQQTQDTNARSRTCPHTVLTTIFLINPN